MTVPPAPDRNRVRQALPRLFGLGLFALDQLMVACALALSVVLREQARAAGWTRGADPGFLYLHFPWILGFTGLVTAVAFVYADLYRDRRFLTGNREAGRVFRIFLAFALVCALLGYLFPLHVIPSRLSLCLLLVFGPALVLLGRRLLGNLRRTLRASGRDIRIALVLGTGPLARRLAEELLDAPGHGYRLLGFVTEERTRGHLDGLRLFGGLDRLERIVRRLRVDEVFVCAPDWTAHRILETIDRLREAGTHVRLVGHHFQIVVERVGVPVDRIDGTPILDFSPAPTSGLRDGGKRAFDLVASLSLLLCLSPLLALIAAAIWLESGRPLLFRQTRLGRDARTFDFLKFRSMVKDAPARQAELLDRNEAKGAMFKIKDDPRITRVGRFLRRYSLDELPQLWNIVRGDMSLVGPRPPVPRELAEYEAWHRERLSGPMGLTGLWQVSGRNAIDFEDMALLDIYYLRNRSPQLDSRILIRTFFTVFLGEGR